MEKYPLEDFNYFKKRKKEELAKEKRELEQALAFFEWLDDVPDGARSIYNVQNPDSMLSLKNDLERERDVCSYGPYKKREYAIEINKFLYYVYKVAHFDGETSWSFNVYQLPDKYADWKSPGY